jgi:hypothetical protein
VLRYGTARKLPEEALRALIGAMSVEVNAQVRIGSHGLDADAAEARVMAMRAFDEALGLFGDEALSGSWRHQLGLMVEDDQVVPAVAGLSLRRLHDLGIWTAAQVATAFSLHTSGSSLQTPANAGAFLESFLSGGSEIILQDQPLLQLVDDWLCELSEEDFVESLPLLRRSFSGFDTVSRRRMLERIAQGRREETSAGITADAEDNPAFAAALPLLLKILGIGGEA